MNSAEQIEWKKKEPVVQTPKVSTMNTQTAPEAKSTPIATSNINYVSENKDENEALPSLLSKYDSDDKDDGSIAGETEDWDFS
jgi:hypothetical protein